MAGRLIDEGTVVEPCEDDNQAYTCGWKVESLRDIRKRLGCTQKELETLAGLAQNQICEIENDCYLLSEQAANKMAPYLGITPRGLRLAHNIWAATSRLESGMGWHRAMCTAKSVMLLANLTYPGSRQEMERQRIMSLLLRCVEKSNSNSL